MTIWCHDEHLYLSFYINVLFLLAIYQRIKEKKINNILGHLDVKLKVLLVSINIDRNQRRNVLGFVLTQSPVAQRSLELAMLNFHLILLPPTQE